MTIITTNIAAVNSSDFNETIVIIEGVAVTTGTVAHTGVSYINYGTMGSLQFNDIASGEAINRDSGIIRNGVDFFGAGNFVNEGVVLAENTGQHGVHLRNIANNNSVINNGEIYGFFGGVTTSSASAMNLRITNTGEIRSDGNGIWMTNAVGAAPVIVNSGTVIGRTNSILAENGNRLNVTNSGSLVGNVLATSVNQSDSLTNDGVITGNVSFGSGNDFYLGSGRVSGIVFGEAGTDKITGGKFADTLDGGAGNDVLIGSLGQDKLYGGANNDVFVFNVALIAASRDTIYDFNLGNDTIQLENAIFTKVGAVGALKPAAFKLSTQVKDADDRIIYNKATGQLFYDSDGSGAAAAIHFATLQNKPTVTAADFAVI